MNLILFTPGEISRPLPAADPRARHLLTTLRRGVGGEFDAGIINGPRGRGRIEAVTADSLRLSFAWNEPPAVAPVVELLVGMPRPQTARDVLRDATTLGATALHFLATEKSDPGYAQSTLWREEEWRRHVLAGAQQAFDTRVPTVSHGRSLAEVLAALPPGGCRLALDNYEATASLARLQPAPYPPLALALGPERGWGAGDRTALRAAGFSLVHLGPRVLRTETAVVAALTLVQAHLAPA